jgi:hypothetical protein
VVTESVGLPDWTPGMAFVLLLIGAPVVLATAFVQEGLSGGPASSEPAGSGDTGADLDAPTENLAAGTGSLDRPTTRPSSTRRLLTWRKVISIS